MKVQAAVLKVIPDLLYFQAWPPGHKVFVSLWPKIGLSGLVCPLGNLSTVFKGLDFFSL